MKRTRQPPDLPDDVRRMRAQLQRAIGRRALDGFVVETVARGRYRLIDRGRIIIEWNARDLPGLHRWLVWHRRQHQALADLAAIALRHRGNPTGRPRRIDRASLERIIDAEIAKRGDPLRAEFRSRMLAEFEDYSPQHIGRIIRSRLPRT